MAAAIRSSHETATEGGDSFFAEDDHTRHDGAQPRTAKTKAEIRELANLASDLRPLA